MKTIILNHKMNLYYNELDTYINEINQIDKNLIIAPSNIYLLEFIKNTNHQIASQDICYIEKDNNTGKVSWSQIKSLGIKYSIIGHSEKNDDIDKVNIKIKTCLDNQITPILCFSNETPEDDITITLNSIKTDNISNIIFAYEPKFNIGSNEIDLEYINKQIDIIYNYLLNKYNQDPVLVYGGGINQNNINKIYQNDKLSGILIGSKSSNIKELKKLLLNINEK